MLIEMFGIRSVLVDSRDVQFVNETYLVAKQKVISISYVLLSITREA